MKKHLSLIIGISLPVLFIIVISIFLFVPVLFIKPAHDFLYTTQDRYTYNERPMYLYSVEKGKLTLDPQPTDTTNTNVKYRTEPPTLYRYDVKNNTSHKITYNEALAFNLDAGPSSPDGYRVEYNYNYDDIFDLFGSRGDDRGYYIAKGNSKKKLPGVTSDRYSNNFSLVGWIK